MIDRFTSNSGNHCLINHCLIVHILIRKPDMTASSDSPTLALSRLWDHRISEKWWCDSSSNVQKIRIFGVSDCRHVRVTLLVLSMPVYAYVFSIAYRHAADFLP